jgi:hypothetical protein
MEVGGTTSGSDSSVQLDPYSDYYYTSCIYKDGAFEGNNIRSLFFADMNNLQNVGSSASGVRLGDGTVPPTPEDWNLSGSMITTFVMTSVVTGVIADDGSCTKTATYTITNSGSTDIVISEIGYFGAIQTHYTNANYNQKSTVLHLLDRTLLEEPVTIPPGGIGQVTYSITIGEPVINQS